MVKPDYPVGPGAGGPAAIDVDAGRLGRFAGSVEGGVEATYRPEAGRLMSVYGTGGHFGLGHPAGEMREAHKKYTECLTNVGEQLAGFANAVKIMVDAARLVSARYGDTDAMSAASQELVEQALVVAKNAAAKELARAGIVDDGPDVPRGTA